MPGLARSKLLKHTHEEALKNPELVDTGVVGGDMCFHVNQREEGLLR